MEYFIQWAFCYLGNEEKNEIMRIWKVYKPKLQINIVKDPKDFWHTSQSVNNGTENGVNSQVNLLKKLKRYIKHFQGVVEREAKKYADKFEEVLQKKPVDTPQ